MVKSHTCNGSSDLEFGYFDSKLQRSFVQNSDTRGTIIYNVIGFQFSKEHNFLRLLAK